MLAAGPIKKHLRIRIVEKCKCSVPNIGLAQGMMSDLNSAVPDSKMAKINKMLTTVNKTVGGCKRWPHLQLGWPLS